MTEENFTQLIGRENVGKKNRTENRQFFKKNSLEG